MTTALKKKASAALLAGTALMTATAGTSVVTASSASAWTGAYVHYGATYNSRAACYNTIHGVERKIANVSHGRVLGITYRGCRASQGRWSYGVISYTGTRAAISGDPHISIEIARRLARV